GRLRKLFLSRQLIHPAPRKRGGETKRSFGGVGFFLIFDLCKRSIVETAIYRVFVMIYRIFSNLEFSSKKLNRTILTVGCDACDV
ncbi:hypothetical protein, partial [Nostoc sp. PCC 9305]|uniref:hypothetical protein n=1 Tax=Nostoc sp. PCC 9305 TaxID=296636 RepID=UPI0039C615C4